MIENNKNNKEKYIELYFPFNNESQTFIEFLNQKYSEGFIFIDKRTNENGYFVIFEKKTKYKYIWKFCPKDTDFIEFINKFTSKGFKFIKSEEKYKYFYAKVHDDECESKFLGYNILFEETYY